MQLTVNGKKVDVAAGAEKPLLWFLRENLGLTGTKYGCGIGACGACTVHINGKSTRSCIVPTSAAVDKQVTTVEGLTDQLGMRLRNAWLDEQVPQCGYCQSGQIMQAAALLKINPKPDRNEVIRYMNGNICRCGTYNRIIKAIENAAGCSLEAANST